VRASPDALPQGASAPNALVVQGLTSGYGEAMVLRDVSFALPTGQVLAVLGKNGMGKSTLLKTIMGFLPVTAGRIRIHGEDTTGLAPHRMVGRGVAYSPQDQAIFQDLTVEENLRLGSRSDRQYAAEVERVCGFFPVLAERRRQRAGTLSGGEQKMLLMARALLFRPRLMLVDEITEGLQPSVVQRLVTVLRTELRTLDVAVLLIEQNVRFALAAADHYAVLTRGEIVDQGPVRPGVEAQINEHLAV
jgi:ABC-type branched-subunit amino acid transport system ATPase component